MFRPDFPQRVEHIVAAKNKLLVGLGSQHEALDAAAIFTEYSRLCRAAASRSSATRRTSCSTPSKPARRLLFEGAQGSLLDIDHGTFPYVTSSNASGVGVSGGSGVPGRWITKVIGVAKAYSTRVGGGPFPTEQDNEIGQQDPRARPRIRHHHRPPAPLRLVRRRRRPLHRPPLRHRLHLADDDGRAQPAARSQNLHRLRTRRPANRPLPQPRRRPAPRASRSTRRSPAGRPT